MVHFLFSTTRVVGFLISTTCVVHLISSTTCVVGLLISTTCVVDCPRTLIFLLLVSMYYCIYMFSYGPHGPEIKHYYYYYYYYNRS